MAFTNEILSHLAAQGVGTVGTNLFGSSKANIPAGAGPYLSVIDTGGTGPTRTQNQAGAATRRPTAQINVRAATQPAAMAMAEAAYVALDGTWNTALSGTMYLSIKARQEPTDAGLDGEGRLMVVFNIDAEKAVSA